MWAKYTSELSGAKSTPTASANGTLARNAIEDAARSQAGLRGRGAPQFFDAPRPNPNVDRSSLHPLHVPPPIRRPRVVDWLLTSSAREARDTEASGAPPSTSSSPKGDTPTGTDAQRVVIAQLLDALEGEESESQLPQREAPDVGEQRRGPKPSVPPPQNRNSSGLSKASFAELGLEPPRNGSTESLDFLAEINDAVVGAQARHRCAMVWEQQQQQHRHQRGHYDGTRGLVANSSGSGNDNDAGEYRKPKALRPRNTPRGEKAHTGSMLPQPVDQDHEFLLERGMEDFEKRRRADTWRRDHQGPSSQTRQLNTSTTEHHRSGSARMDVDVEDFLRRSFSAFEEKQRETKKKSMLAHVRPRVVDTWAQETT